MTDDREREPAGDRLRGVLPKVRWEDFEEASRRAIAEAEGNDPEGEDTQ